LDGTGYRRCPIHQLLDERVTNVRRSTREVAPCRLKENREDIYLAPNSSAAAFMKELKVTSTPRKERP
jgi:hypothetical protein